MAAMPVLHFNATFEGLPQEEFMADGALAADSIWRVQALMNGVYEFTCDLPTPGNRVQTVNGHRHSGIEDDGAFIARQGSLVTGNLLPGYCDEQVSLCQFEMFNSSSPQNGQEASGLLCAVNRLRVYCTRDYNWLKYFCRLRCQLEGACARASLILYDADGDQLAIREVEHEGVLWGGYELSMPVPDDNACNGWLQLELRLDRTSGSGQVYIDSSDRWNSDSNINGCEAWLY